MTDPFWSDRFHWCALAVGFLAASEGWLSDSERVRREVYALYEAGGFRDRPPLAPCAGAPVARGLTSD